MTPQQRKGAARYLKNFDFSGLFTDPSIGWNWPDSVKPPQSLRKNYEKTCPLGLKG